MAVFIKGTIVPNNFKASEFGETTSLVDLIGQVKAQADDTPLTVYIDSPGGVVDEGFAIHDYLLSLDRPIKTIAINQCASIATVVFLSGTSRVAHCDLMIHNPWSTADGDSSIMQQNAEILETCEKRLEKFYADKLGIAADVISNLMQWDTLISPDQALALGFATEEETTSQPMAMILTQNTNANKQQKKMKQPLHKRVAQAMAILLGASLNLELTTADGSMLTVEREEGDPQVGDVASPDGEHTMTDGSVITVSDGVITKITEAEEEPSTEEELEQANARIADLESQLAEKNLSPDDVKALAAVKALGGIDGLSKICSTYKPQARESAQTASTGEIPKYKQKLNTYKNKK